MGWPGSESANFMDDEHVEHIRRQQIEAAARKAQKAIAMCLEAGGVIGEWGDASWFDALVDAQRDIAKALSI